MIVILWTIGADAYMMNMGTVYMMQLEQTIEQFQVKDRSAGNIGSLATIYNEILFTKVPSADRSMEVINLQ